ncbi:Uncharacterized protein YfiR precursor [plant metagenome]|uniref:Uncharacterized protein YfiR n=1 Tax=plant metagenome TaxID=1297885 RepID=A0A484Y883_9ZZZZ
MPLSAWVTGRVWRGPLACALLSLALLAVCARPAGAQAAPAAAFTQAQVRSASVAAVVLGILSYARWPGMSAELRLCVLAPTQYADALLGQPQVSVGRKVISQRYMVDSPELAHACDAIYTGVLKAEEKRALYRHLNGQAVLSISEDDPECAVGPMFCLDVSDAQVAFQVNLDSVARSGVRINPNVLKLGRSRAVQP